MRAAKDEIVGLRRAWHLLGDFVRTPVCPAVAVAVVVDHCRVGLALLSVCSGRSVSSTRCRQRCRMPDRRRAGRSRSRRCTLLSILPGPCRPACPSCPARTRCLSHHPSGLFQAPDARAGPSARRPRDPVRPRVARAEDYSAAGGSGSGGKSPEKMSPTNSSLKPGPSSLTRMAERPSWTPSPVQVSV